MNKLIIVTGGTQGIGRAVIEKFAFQGFDIVSCARTAASLDELGDSIRAQFPGVSCHVTRADLSKKNQVRDFCDFVNALKCPIDVLVNNAGIFLPGQIATESDGALESMINANLYSAYNTTRGLLPLMKNTGKAHIFNICSIASFTAYPNGGSYAISKFAMLGFTKCLRAELKTAGIRVTAVMPGATLTDSWKGTEMEDERFMKPEDVADAIYGAYSLSERSVVEEIVIRPQLGDL